MLSRFIVQYAETSVHERAKAHSQKPHTTAPTYIHTHNDVLGYLQTVYYVQKEKQLNMHCIKTQFHHSNGTTLL